MTDNAFKGLGAVVFNTLAVVTSFQETFEYTLRCASLLIGCIVGLLTIRSLLKSRKRGNGP